MIFPQTRARTCTCLQAIVQHTTLLLFRRFRQVPRALEAHKRTPSHERDFSLWLFFNQPLDNHSDTHYYYYTNWVREQDWKLGFSQKGFLGSSIQDYAKPAGPICGMFSKVQRSAPRQNCSRHTTRPTNIHNSTPTLPSRLQRNLSRAGPRRRGSERTDLERAHSLAESRPAGLPRLHTAFSDEDLSRIGLLQFSDFSIGFDFLYFALLIPCAFSWPALRFAFFHSAQFALEFFLNYLAMAFPGKERVILVFPRLLAFAWSIAWIRFSVLYSAVFLYLESVWVFEGMVFGSGL